MPVNLSQAIVDSIISAAPADKAEAYREALSANGTPTEEGWEFPDCEAMQRAHDLFYPGGRPPGPAIPARHSLPSGAEVEAMLDAQGWSQEAAIAEAKGGCGCSPPRAD